MNASAPTRQSRTQPRRQTRGGGHCGDRRGAAGRLRAGLAVGPADLRLRSSDHSRCAAAEPPVAMAYREGSVLGRAAAGRGPLRDGRGAGAHGRNRRARGAAHDGVAQSAANTAGPRASSSRLPTTPPTTCRSASSPDRSRRRITCRPRHPRGSDRGRSWSNLSVTGSLATILWLVALRREDLTSAPGTSCGSGSW